MGANAQRIFGGFAAALGDKTIDWAEQGVIEHYPQYASDPKSIALIADERQLDTYPGEPSSSLAARSPYWLEINKFRGRGIGILLGLHFSGFDGAVLLQQNGRALSLSLPLPDFTGNWDPTPNLVVQQTSTVGVPLTSSIKPPTVSSAGRSIPVGTKWVGFDSNTDFSSRFVVVFPSAVQRITTYSTATFTGTEDGSAAHPWPTATWSVPFLSAFTGYDVIVGPPKVTGSTPPMVVVSADSTGKTGTGVRIISTASFTGSVDVKAVLPVNASLLKATIQKWKPAKATCLGVYEYRTSIGAQGWLIRKMGDGTLMGATSVNQLVAGSF